MLEFRPDGEIEELKGQEVVQHGILVVLSHFWCLELLEREKADIVAGVRVLLYFVKCLLNGHSLLVGLHRVLRK